VSRVRSSPGGVAIVFRGFISADFPPTSGILRILEQLRTSGASLKVVTPDRLHVTLKFLGDTEEGSLPEIVTTVRAACRGVGPVPVRLHGTGAFPNASRMTVLWIGLEGAEPLAAIARTLDASLAALGFPPERRPWSPHLTLARVKGGRNLDRVRQIVRAHEGEPFGDFVVTAVRLKKSLLTPQGPVYSTLEEVAL